MTKLKNWVKSNSWNWSRLFLRKQHFRFLWKEQRAKWGKHFQTWGCDILEFQRRHWSVLAMKFHLQISCKINFHNSLSSCLHIQNFFIIIYFITIFKFSCSVSGKKRWGRGILLWLKEKCTLKSQITGPTNWRSLPSKNVSMSQKRGQSINCSVE